jgi:hypothetical protein
MYVSSLVGAACLKLRTKKSNTNTMHRRLKTPHGILREIACDKRVNSVTRNQAALFDTVLRLIEHQNQPREFARLRQQLQVQTCQQLAQTLARIDYRKPLSRLPNKRYVGHISELATLGFINRTEQSGRLALPAPPHHDQAKTPGQGYDVILIDAGDNEPKSYTLQVKTGCRQACRGGNERFGYDDHILLVSGHCDLGIDKSKGEEGFTPPWMLADEHLTGGSGIWEPRTTSFLQTMSNRLLARIEDQIPLEPNLTA